MSHNAMLREFRSYSDANVIIETSNDSKDLFMAGIFIQGDVKNQNQRVYPLNEIKRAVESMRTKISKGDTVMGECDHPQELSINLDRVSHIITDMWMTGADGHGKLKIIDTPCGQIIKTLLKSGAKLGVSSRGSGNVLDDGTVEDFDIVTVDIVAQPSAPDAYPRTIYESLYNMRGGMVMLETAEATKHDPAAQKYLDRDIIKFINELKM